MIATATDVPKRTAALGPGDSVPDWVAAYFGPRLDTGQVMRSYSVSQDSGAKEIVRVWHERSDGRWPFGTALALLRQDSTLRWIGDFLGDYPPYRIRWVDLNADGAEDLLMTGGEEDVYNTWIYLDGGDGGGFMAVLHDTLTYLGAVDLDGDGIPELTGKAFDEDPGMDVLDPCEGREVPDPVLIRRVHGRAAVDVTSEFKERISAHRTLAVESRNGASVQCRAKLDSIIDYFDRVLTSR